jgi:hypothetical protein
MTAKQKWLRTLAWLREEFPSPYAVTVRTIKGQKEQGLATRVGRKFDIKVKAQCLNLKIDTILHEWAHLLTWHGNDEDDHGEEWSLMYGRIYRQWLTWNYGRNNGEEDET